MLLLFYTCVKSSVLNPKCSVAVTSDVSDENIINIVSQIWFEPINAVYAFVIQSEFLSNYDKRRGYITGFQGSAGQFS